MAPKHSPLLLLASSVLYSVVQSQECYYAADKQTDPRITPCSNTENGAFSICCLAGNYCLEDGACFDPRTYVTYLYGCNDPTYKDPRCPPKWDFDLDASPWAAITKTNCSNTNPPTDVWTGVHPSSCGGKACPPGPWNPVEFAIPHVGCDGLEPRSMWMNKTAPMATWSIASPYIPPPTPTPTPEPESTPEPEPTSEPTPSESSGWEISNGDGPVHSDPTSTAMPSFQTVTIETTESTAKPYSSSSPANETPVQTMPAICRTKTIAFATAIGVAGALLLIQAALFICYIRRLRKKSTHIDEHNNKKFDEKSIGEDVVKREKRERERVEYNESPLLTSISPLPNYTPPRAGFQQAPTDQRLSWMDTARTKALEQGDSLVGMAKAAPRIVGKAVVELARNVSLKGSRDTTMKTPPKQRSQSPMFSSSTKRIDQLLDTSWNARIRQETRKPLQSHHPQQSSLPAKSSPLPPSPLTQSSTPFPPAPAQSPQSGTGHELTLTRALQNSGEQIPHSKPRQMSGEQLPQTFYVRPTLTPTTEASSRPSFESQPRKSPAYPYPVSPLDTPQTPKAHRKSVPKPTGYNDRI